MQASSIVHHAHLDHFDVSICETDEGYSLSAFNVKTRRSYLPCKIFQGISKSTVLKHLNDPITIKEVGDNFISVQLEFYDDPFKLDAQDDTEQAKQINLLKSEVNRLKEENQTQKELFESKLSELALKVSNLELENKTKMKQFHGICDNWQPYENLGIMMTVDISKFGLKNTPHVQTSLVGNLYHYLTTGVTSLYGLTNTSFTVYINLLRLDAPTPDFAKAHNWQLSYIVTSLDE